MPQGKNIHNAVSDAFIDAGLDEANFITTICSLQHFQIKITILERSTNRYAILEIDRDNEGYIHNVFFVLNLLSLSDSVATRFQNFLYNTEYVYV